jgi:hypothetical protein
MSDPDLPDFLQPAPDDGDTEFEALLERAQQVEEMSATPAFTHLRDYLLSRAQTEEHKVIGGRMTHEEYLRRTGIIAGLLMAVDAPKQMRAMAETRRPTPPTEE